MHVKEIFRLHGIPRKIFSDRGAVFAARVTKALYKQLGINIGLTTAYHPAANGQVERKNRDIEQFLRMFVKQRQDDWADLLPIAEFVLNSRKTSATDHTPFELNYGYTPDFTIPVGKASNMPLVNQRLDKPRQARKEAEEALKLGKERMKEDYEKGKKKAHKFEVGDLVWLDSKDIKIRQPADKLGPKRLGPYPISETVGDLDYRLDLSASPGLKIHRVLHVDRLSPWHGNEVNGIKPEPPSPIKVEGEDGYEVQEIRDSRFYCKQLQYLVRWRGYGPKHDSWEPLKNLDHAERRITQFHQKNPSAPKKIATSIFTQLHWQPIENLTHEHTDLQWEKGKQSGISYTIEDNGP